MINFFKKRFQNLNISETILIKKAQSGNGKAFGELYLKYLDPIYRYIFYRVGQNKEDAEDLTEVVFFKAWSKLGSFQEEGRSFKAWLYAIAHNCVIDHYRQDNKQVALDEEVQDLSLTPEEEVLKKSEKDEITLALNKLTPDQQQIIILKFIEGLSYEEIETILNKNQESLRALQYRALKQLRKEFNGKRI